MAAKGSQFTCSHGGLYLISLLSLATSEARKCVSAAPVLLGKVDVITQQDFNLPGTRCMPLGVGGSEHPRILAVFWNKPEDLIPTLDVPLHSLYVHVRAALASWHLSVALFLKCVCCWNRQVLLRPWEATVSTSSLVFQFRAVCLAQSSGRDIVPGSCVITVGLEVTILIHFPGNTGEILNVKL